MKRIQGERMAVNKYKPAFPDSGQSQRAEMLIHVTLFLVTLFGPCVIFAAMGRLLDRYENRQRSWLGSAVLLSRKTFCIDNLEFWRMSNGSPPRRYHCRNSGPGLLNVLFN